MHRVLVGFVAVLMAFLVFSGVPSLSFAQGGEGCDSSDGGDSSDGSEG